MYLIDAGSLGDRAGGGPGRPLVAAATLALVPLLGAARGLRRRAPPRGREPARARTAPTAAPRSCSATSSRPTTATRASTARASSSSPSRSPTQLDSTPSSGGTSNSAPSSTTSARSRSPRRSSTSPGKLDPDEWTIIKTHTLEGQQMLDRVGGFMRDVGLIVRSHHERWDGARLPGRPRRRGDPARGADHRLLRLLERDATDRAYR